MTKEEKIKELELKISELQGEIQKLKEPDTYYVVVSSDKENYDVWYQVGSVYKVFSDAIKRDDMEYYPLVTDTTIGIGTSHATILREKAVIDVLESTNIKHKF